MLRAARPRATSAQDCIAGAQLWWQKPARPAGRPARTRGGALPRRQPALPPQCRAAARRLSGGSRSGDHHHAAGTSYQLPAAQQREPWRQTGPLPRRAAAHSRGCESQCASTRQDADNATVEARLLMQACRLVWLHRAHVGVCLGRARGTAGPDAMQTRAPVGRVEQPFAREGGGCERCCPAQSHEPQVPHHTISAERDWRRAAATHSRCARASNGRCGCQPTLAGERDATPHAVLVCGAGHHPGACQGQTHNQCFTAGGGALARRTSRFGRSAGQGDLAHPAAVAQPHMPLV